MITHKYINEKRLLADVVSIDPIRYRNKNNTPVLNAVVKTVRQYKGGVEKEDFHNIVIYGQSAVEFSERVAENDVVYLDGYVYTRERKIDSEESTTIIIEDTMCVEWWIPMHELVEAEF